MVPSTSNPDECFLLAENVLRNVAHTDRGKATKFPVVELGLKLGAGRESRKVVAIPKAEASFFASYENRRGSQRCGHSP
jgi:hypothetical protein